MGTVHLEFNVSFEDCDQGVIEAVTALTDQIRDSIQDALRKTGTRLHVERHASERGEATSINEILPRVMLLHEDAAWLKQIIVRALEATNAHTDQNKSDADRDALLDEDMQVSRDLVAARELLEERIGG
jgi:hypothetical protein